MTTTFFHGSRVAALTTIHGGGLFGGVFGHSSRAVAASHGDHIYIVTSPNHCDVRLSYSDEAYDAAKKMGLSDVEIESVLDPSCPVEDDFCGDVGEESWRRQALRGRVAAALGYTSVDMRDEHGMSALCLPGCTIKRV